MRQGRWIIGSLMLMAWGAHTPLRAADERPQTLGEAKAKDQLQKLGEIATLPIIQAKNVSEVVQIDVKDNDLIVSTHLPATEEAVVRTPGLGGLSTVTRAVRQFDPVRPPMSTLEFHNFDYTIPNYVCVHTSVSDAPGKLMLVQDFDALEDQVHSIQLLQNTGEVNEGDARVTLYVQITGTPAVDIRRQANSIVELRRQFPAETRLYVDPIFRTLRQEGVLSRVDPRLAWQVLADGYSPSAQLQSDVKVIVTRLDADNFADREAASRDLEKLGQPAALALMKIDRKALSDEQKGRVDAFLATFKTVPSPQARQLRLSRDFLLDCLYCDDLALRQRALEQLQSVAGHAIEFDLSAEPAKRLAAIEKLRSSLGTAAATQATTRDQ